MTRDAPRDILIAGAGIAGLTAALAFAERGSGVTVVEKAVSLDEVGAGLQLSPNATRILDALGVLDRLDGSAVRPDAVVLRSARTLRQLGGVPLGEQAVRRWGAPYLTCHRADLQRALLESVSAAGVELILGCEIADVEWAGRTRVALSGAGGSREHRADLIVGADGVHSALRQRMGLGGTPSDIGILAWRLTLPADQAALAGLSHLRVKTSVCAFLHPGFHLIAYPVRRGEAVNIVAFTKAPADAAATIDMSPLRDAMRNTAGELRVLADLDGWTTWPIRTATTSRWTDPRGLALVGDAAHAMTPFAAQGAAMAIEDAATLATAFAGEQPSVSLPAWEADRRSRVARVARRGAFNRMVWHASGPLALARDIALRLRPSDRLAADLDWLYGWDSLSSPKM